MQKALELIFKYFKARNVATKINGKIELAKIERRINDMKLRMKKEDFEENIPQEKSSVDNINELQQTIINQYKEHFHHLKKTKTPLVPCPVNSSTPIPRQPLISFL